MNFMGHNDSIAFTAKDSSGHTKTLHAICNKHRIETDVMIYLNGQDEQPILITEHRNLITPMPVMKDLHDKKYEMPSDKARMLYNELEGMMA